MGCSALCACSGSCSCFCSCACVYLCVCLRSWQAGSVKDDAGDGGSEADAAESAAVAQKKAAMPGSTLGLLANVLTYSATKATLMYTFAYWIKWKPLDTLSDQVGGAQQTTRDTRPPFPFLYFFLSPLPSPSVA